MKIAVSYISSKFNFKTTIGKINESTADYIHVDLMDGKMVKTKNFNIFKIKKLLKLSTKPLDIHLMVKQPSKLLKHFKCHEQVKNLYFHPKYEKETLNFIDALRKYVISPGIVIDMDEEIDEFFYILPHVDRVLVMSVQAGYGGQEFMYDSLNKVKNLLKYRKEKNLDFKISVDGGINNKTIKLFDGLDIETFISGSYITNEDDFDKQINRLKK